ncbi:HAD family hydrolase [Bifidobacterium simiiventris]|uniref:HAD family hydrolase n=1 Tax=Bifidobacterium simiiventris TaxID=2834434 RepID=UPI001C55C670|nr:HAD family hydrolase [Bifidobacterium simiiventris]MBW3079476.1 HAD family hydrolase [Bifidobacterium simiiventris]
MRYDAVLFDLYGTLVDIRTDEWSDDAWSALRDGLISVESDRGPSWGGGRGSLFADVSADAHAAVSGRASWRDCDAATVRDVFNKVAAPIRAEAVASYGKWAEPDLLPVYAQMAGVGISAQASRLAWTFRQASTRKLRLYPGALQLLGDLHKAGLRVVLVSNAQACYTRPELLKLGLNHVFDRIVISSEEGVRKPSPEIYQRALAREGLRPERAVMIGNDERADIIGARSAGIDGIYLRTEISPSDDPTVSSYALQSFAGADYAGVLRFLGIRR